MARHRKVSILTLLGVGVGLVNGATQATDNWTEVKPLYVLNGASEAFLGYDFINKKFNAQDLLMGWGPTVVGYLAHVVMKKIGIEKMFMIDGVEL